eukprot:jgi/Galph1/1012/GphlegSOOS_G5780.1
MPHRIKNVLTYYLFVPLLFARFCVAVPHRYQTCKQIFRFDTNFNSVLNIDRPGRLSFYGNPSLEDLEFNKKVFPFESIGSSRIAVHLRQRLRQNQQPVWVLSKKLHNGPWLVYSLLCHPNAQDGDIIFLFEGFIELRYFPKHTGFYSMDGTIFTEQGAVSMTIFSQRGTPSEFVDSRRKRIWFQEQYNSTQRISVNIALQLRKSEKMKFHLNCLSSLCKLSMNFNLSDCGQQVVNLNVASNWLTFQQHYRRPLILIRPFVWSQVSKLQTSIRTWDHEEMFPCSQNTSQSIDLAFYISGSEHTLATDLFMKRVRQQRSIKKCFGKVMMLYSYLSPVYDRHPDGTCFMFYSLFDSVNEVSLHYDAFFYMEPDVQVIRRLWLDNLVNTYFTLLKKSSFWLAGKYAFHDWHINGNAFYNLRDRLFRQYLLQVRHYYFPRMHVRYAVGCSGGHGGYDHSLYNLPLDLWQDNQQYNSTNYARNVKFVHRHMLTIPFVLNFCKHSFCPQEVKNRVDSAGSASKYCLACYCLVWLSSIVVFGSAADVANINDHCNGYCGFSIACGVLSFLVVTTMIVLNLFELQSILKFEFIPALFLLLLWAAGAGVISSVRGESVNTPVSVGFAWVSLIGVMALCFILANTFDWGNIHLRVSPSSKNRMNDTVTSGNTTRNTTNHNVTSSSYIQA